jgi:hypothetical protein
MKKGTNLILKASAIAGAALAAIYGVENKIETKENFSDDTNSIQVKVNSKKPMPVLKLNLSNVEDSKFIASHTSHRSHSSHRSHYSHRSGAMFS